MGGWLQDIRFGARFLSKHPAFTAVVVLTLALGIGAGTAMYSVVAQVLLKPLPYDDPGRLVLIRHDIGRTDFVDAPVPPADVIDLREQVDVFESIAATDRTYEANLTGDGPPEVVRVAGVTPNFFDVLGTRAALGRTFVPEDGQALSYSDGGHDDSATAAGVVISHGLWQRRFGADESAVGSLLLLNDRPARIVGVLPREFRLHMPVNAGMSTDIDVWNPTRFDYRRVPRNSPNANRRIIARLLPGVSLADARRQVDAVAAWQRETYDYHRLADIRITVTPMRAAIVGHVRPILLGLFAAVGIVLLIACANVANLLLVQAIAREREIAIRAAVGGGRRRILRQLMTESLLLAAIGGLAGLLVARWGIDLLLAVRPANLPRLEAVPIDGGALLFTAAVTLFCALLFGSFPALQTSDPDLHGSLNERGLATADRRRHSLRGVLVAGEVALAMVLLVGAGLMARSLRGLDRVDLGFRPDSVLTFQVTLPAPRYPTAEDRAEFHERLETAVLALDQVAAIGATSVLPLSGEFWTSPYEVSERSGREIVGREANYQMVRAGTFDALGLKLVAGRLFTADEERGRKDVVVVDRLLAARAWPGASPVGREVQAESFGGSAGRFQVVGVVEPMHLDDPRQPSRETIFFPHATQGALASMTVVVRATGVRAEALAGPLTEIVRTLDPELPVGAVRPLNAYVGDATAPLRFATLLAGLFAVVALVLAAIGVYGVVSSLVRQRTREIGLHLALGAPHPQIMRSVVGRGVRLGVIGVVAGLAVSLGLARLTASLVTGVSPTDPLTYAAVAALLLAVTALASVVPARRAVHVNPTDALRYE
jgi:putative ABC transport system permease protein